MSNADKRSTSTDALETLGMIHFKQEHRDAIHLAVEPVEAGMDMHVGQDIGIHEGRAYPAGIHDHGMGLFNVKAIGIVDPFLPARGVRIGQKFWLVVYPRMITSLRHVWSHPDFPESK